MSTRHYDRTVLHHAPFGGGAAVLGFALSHGTTPIDCDKSLTQRSVTA